MSPCDGGGILTFNDSVTHPYGILDLTMSLGEGSDERKVTLCFLEISCRRAFNGIPGRPFLQNLNIVASSITTKVAYNSNGGEPVIINANI